MELTGATVFINDVEIGATKVEFDVTDESENVVYRDWSKSITIPIKVDVAAFMEALRKAHEALVGIPRQRQRIRHMHSAYSRQRGRGHW